MSLKMLSAIFSLSNKTPKNLIHVGIPFTIAALAMFLISVIVAASLLWAGVRSGITAIGRNPLSQNFIIRGLDQVIILAAAVFAIGLFGVYLLLRL